MDIDPAHCAACESLAADIAWWQSTMMWVTSKLGELEEAVARQLQESEEDCE